MMKQRFSTIVCACLCLLMFSGSLLAEPARAAQSEQTADADDPSKGSKDVDRTVSFPLAQVLDAAKLALATYGCEVKKEERDFLECTRSRHVGVLVGSGGEIVTVKLSGNGNETRVVIKTGKGFVGRLGKKNWSTPIFDEIVKTLGRA